MLSRNLADQLQAATGIDQAQFGDLYRTRGCNAQGLGAIYFWMIRGETFVFVPIHRLLSPCDFATIVGLAEHPDKSIWRPLMKQIMASAVVLPS
jgi:hypothetical protein